MASKTNEKSADPDPRAAKNLVDVAVLDDDPDFLAYMQDFLEDEGRYRVRTFRRPTDLYASGEKRPPEIVLLDMKMGPVDGATVLEELQRRWADLCIIIVTGYPSLEDMRATFKRKVFDYLAKPFSLSQMRQVLRNAIDAYGLGRAPQDRLRDELGRRIKMLRTERGWSLKELARESGISVSQLSSIERGAHMPSMESFLSLSMALGKRPSELLAAIEF